MHCIRFTKVGFAGNDKPLHIIPTAICEESSGVNKALATQRNLFGGNAGRDGTADLNFCIGNEAMEYQTSKQISYPIRHGQVDNWDLMERYWQQCIFKHLRCEPENHAFVLVITSNFAS